MANAEDVANKILQLADKENIGISNLKLQKLLYFAQAYSIAKTGDPLIDQDFEAWTYGPVVPSIYRKYKEYGYHSIPKSNEKINLDDNQNEIINTVFSQLGNMNPFDLVDITHKHKPWKKRYGQVDPVIRISDFKDFYAQKKA
ncbi:Panacea domain-containing protein [Sporolactobacillus terrae]|uniref:Panacea domain-containing protein n=1 Tax=Sporolactobacillus terrae TaxID=269673 RepID=UPI00159BE775|nr:type II toxin-antitoxin system antitoxin SocA domain-containing protein [Sporolactobacillus terrae]